MRPTKLKGQLAASAIIIAGLAGTLSITSQASDVPASNVPASDVPTSNVPADKTAAFKIRMSLNVDEAYEIELNKRRAAIASGEMAPGELLNWSYADRGTLYENHIIIIGDEAGGLKTHLTDAGGTPIETPFDSKVHEAMKPAVQRCQARAAQTLQMTVYNAWLDIADKKVPGGPYKVYCYPGSESEQKAQSAETKIEGIMASGDVDIESRRAISAGVLIRDRLAKFDAEYPNPTGQQTYDNCVSIKIALNNDFRTAEDRWTDAEMRKSCEHHL